MKPLAEIVNVYDGPLWEDAIKTEYNVNRATIERAEAIKKDLTSAIERIRASLKVEYTPPISLPKDKAKELRIRIAKDEKWREAYEGLIRTLLPGIDIPVESAEDLFLPWWNGNQMGLIGDSYKRGIMPVVANDENFTILSFGKSAKLTVRLSYSHSYIDQLTRSGKYPQVKIDPVSVAGVLTTSDNLLVLGWRGGQSFGDTLMNVPAGSLEPYTGINPLFESFYKELEEEVGLTKTDITKEESGLVGRALDHVLQERSYYVFRAKTKHSFAELLESWESSEDKKEHKYLTAFVNNPASMLKNLRARGFNYERAREYCEKNKVQIAVTCQENIGTILPPCVCSILADYSQNQGEDWAREAEKYLEEKYDLTSCLK